MRSFLLILFLFTVLTSVGQVTAPLQTFINGGAATGAVHPSTSIPTHFSSFGQPMFVPRTFSNQTGAGTFSAVDLMFTLGVYSFSPTTGAIGSTVTIDGTGFSETPGSNVVRFGATRASVISATRQTLMVIVPPGATYEPISVTVDGRTAYSTLNHSVIFAGSADINGRFTSTPELLDMGTTVIDVKVVDMDGDGKPDLCATVDGSPSFLLVLPNVHSTGMVTQASFAGTQQLIVESGSNAQNLTVGDIDSDGKLDLIVCYNSTEVVSVFRNTSVPGSITFASRLDVPVAHPAMTTCISDLDRDGKLDLVVKYAASVGILKNKSEPASISFYPHVEFTPSPVVAGTNISATDLNGDQRPELIYSTQNDETTVRILRNETIAGSIEAGSFPLGFDFVNTGLVGGANNWHVAFGDLDGDGGIDLLTPSVVDGKVWILRNLAVPDPINAASFESAISLTGTSALAEVAVGDLNGDGKPEVVASSSSGLSIFTNAAVSGSLAAGSFPTRIDRTLANAVNVVIADLNADGQPELLAAHSSSISIFNNIEDNVPPSVSDLSPDDDAVGVVYTIDLTITFDEPVLEGTGDILLKRQSDNATVRTFVVGSEATVTGSSLIIDPPTDLPYLSDLYVLVPAGAVTDLAGNPFAGITLSTEWSFQTLSDSDRPVVIGRDPPMNQIDVDFDDPLILTFNESIEKNIGNILIKRVSDNLELKNISVATDSVSISGATLTISHTRLDPSTEVYVIIPGLAIQDQSGNFFTGYSDNTGWRFTTEDDLSDPGLVNLSPAISAAGISTNADLIMTFDEPIVHGSGDILVMEGSNEIKRFTNPDGEFKFIGNQVIMSKNDFWPANQALHIIIPNGAIEDAHGNTFDGYSTDTDWWFETGSGIDVTAPVITNYSPKNETVQRDATLEIAFDESILPGTPNATIKIYRYSDDLVVQTFTLTDPGILVGDKTITITPDLLPEDTKFFLAIEDGIVKNLAKLLFDGNMARDDWSFTTVPQPPSLTDILPANGETGVAVDATLGLEFDEDVVAGTGNIYIRRLSDGGLVYKIPASDSRILISGRAMTISPAGLPPGLTLYVTIDVGAIKDQTGNDYAGLSSSSAWNFTTVGVPELVGPTLSGTTPTDDAVDVQIAGELVLTFNENVAPGGGTIFISRVGGAAVLSIDVQDLNVSFDGFDVIITYAGLPFGTELYVVMGNGVITDLSGNYFAGMSDALTFTTAGDLVAPVLTNRFPVDNAPEVPVGDNLTLIFDEDIQKGTGSISIMTGLTTLLTVPLSDVEMNTSKEAMINPPSDLPYNKEVYVLIPAGAFKDMANNDFPGFALEGEWNFTTEKDPTGPLLDPNTSDPSVLPLQPAHIKVVLYDDESEVGSNNTVGYRTLGSTETANISPLTLTDGVWTAEIDGSFAKDGGIEYWIHAFNTSNSENLHGPFVIPIASQDEGLIIPYSKFGHKPSFYRIVAVPLALNDKSVSDVFADDLDPQKDRKWRVAHYSEGKTIQDYDGDIVPGKGYWLIVEKDPKKLIDSGPGTTINVNSENWNDANDAQKGIALSAGWNQIGNPYNFSIAAASLTANTTLTSFTTYPEGSPQPGHSLKPMEGGFIFSSASGKLWVEPVKGSGRVGEARDLRNPLDDMNWELLLNLAQGELQNTLAGVGMRSDASDDYDVHDGMSLPRFYDYLEVNHTGSVAGYHYSKDVVPTADTHIWEFSVESSLKDGMLSFSWDNSYMGKNNKELVLFDVTNQRPVDMKLNTGYQFERAPTNQFKVVFGDRAFVEEHTHVNRVVIHQVFPNPAGSEVNVMLGIPSDAWTSVELHDLLGRKVATLYEGEFRRGNHEINAKRTDGEETGLYLIVVKAAGQMATSRVILK